jgi:hypothetical protein
MLPQVISLPQNVNTGRTRVTPAALRRMTRDFREPVIWVVLVTAACGVAPIAGVMPLGQDLIKVRPGPKATTGTSWRRWSL